MSIGVVVLAAGMGTRMKSGRAKVLHEAAGRSLLEWVLLAVDDVEPEQVSIVVGHDAERVASVCPDSASVVVQEPQNGTADAARVGLGGLDSSPNLILVVPGDMPLIRGASLADLVAHHKESGAAATIMTVELEDPTGYGRIIRDGGSVAGIVEEKDATETQKDVCEVNTSVYVFDGALFSGALRSVGNDNAQGEYYLTDVIGVLVDDGGTVEAVSVEAIEGIGVNTQRQLAEVGATLRQRINSELLDDGVWMLDPSRVYIDAQASIEPGVRIYPDTYVFGFTTIATGAEIGPNVELRNTRVSAGARIQQAVAINAVVGENATVGPFAYLRPGAELGSNAKAGTYVEIKASHIGDGSKVPHLSYIGDATIGEDSNVGAGTITVNYDGFNKHKTVIGDRVRIGSDSMLVAPVNVGDDAYTAAGSAITDDVPDGALAIERSEQKNVDGYAAKRRGRAERDER
ncbi:MAG: bifunctional UDP-N-acetylglucosamine diphosphorylase/glucosamine-1-phosphate N-acetyltransferase GlmU [Acidimicrobiia bacterium]